MSSSADVSPSITPSGTPLSGTHAPKYGTVIPNRIFVGGIAANTTEAELKQFFTAYGAVKDSKIIADRAGVSKGYGSYGFITFENQEDAERIIKKESDNLIFRDRKLNIGPAVRKQNGQWSSSESSTFTYAPHSQVLPRTFDSTIPTGTVLFTNGVPYTYQNGMAIFHAPEGGYPIHQPQVNPQQPAFSTVMVPQTPTMYVTPQYSAYQPTTPQWATTAGQWRWAPQSPGQTVGGSPGYIYAAMHASPELMYAQPPPHAYQPADLTDAAMLEGAPVEGSAVQLCQEPPIVSHTYVTDASLSTSDQQQTLTAPIPTVAMTMPLQHTTPAVATPMLKSSSSAAASVAPYAKKTVTTIPRRTFSSPTYLVKHGNKVQRVMIPSKPLSVPGSHMTLIRSPDSGSGDATEGVGIRHALLTPPPDK